MQEIEKYCDPGAAIVIVGNKCDRDECDREVTEEEGKNLARSWAEQLKRRRDYDCGGGTMGTAATRTQMHWEEEVDVEWMQVRNKEKKEGEKITCLLGRGRGCVVVCAAVVCCSVRCRVCCSARINHVYSSTHMRCLSSSSVLLL